MEWGIGSTANYLLGIALAHVSNDALRDMTWAPRSRFCFNKPFVHEILPTATDVYSAYLADDNKNLTLELRSPKSSVDVLLRNVRCVHSISSMDRVIQDWIVLTGPKRSRAVARAHIASAPTDFARNNDKTPMMDANSFLVVRVQVPCASRLTLTLTLDPNIKQQT